MDLRPLALHLLEQEARALRTRLDRVRPFALQETMLPAATPSPEAMGAIERYLARGRRELRERVAGFLAWLRGPEGRRADPAEAQRRLTLLRLQFNAVLTQFDLFADALTQRSEHDVGVWLAGLDAAAADALALPGYYEAPPVVCYLDRGVGAAIRRARTRLPGGGENPVAVIRVPRERMVGSGIASSLVHEVGHQASALLGLVPSLRRELREVQARREGQEKEVWKLWERWLSEILADFWAVARVGVAATLGLMGVVSLPRAFVFRLNADDPHPMPWIRVKLSCAMGQALYPHPQWMWLAALWEAYYPAAGLDAGRRELLRRLEGGAPELAVRIAEHRPDALRGKGLNEVLGLDDRRPATLSRLWNAQGARGAARFSPTLAFALLGQARGDGRSSPEEESRVVSRLLQRWALGRALGSSYSRTRPLAPQTQTHSHSRAAA